MDLVIFDIDGTLTRTTEVDARCALRAFAEEFAITNIESDWSRYQHPSDAGITHEVLERKFGRPAREGEVARLRRRFLALLGEAYSENPSAFVQTPGAGSALARLAADRRWAVALATGGWRETSLFKLEKAGIDIGDLPAAFSDDDPRREEILRAAVRYARERERVPGFERVVALGDAVWDVRAARNVDFAFVGVATGQREEALRKIGAAEVISDFRDLDALYRALERAKVPSPEL